MASLLSIEALSDHSRAAPFTLYEMTMKYFRLALLLRHPPDKICLQGHIDIEDIEKIR
jgi:hypothetical protein